MKIFSASQIRACDAYTIHASKIKSYDLMETAATACVSWLEERMPAGTLYIVLCGPGNNGGDGLAITRLLRRRGYGAKAFLLPFSDVLSPDCQLNADRLTKDGEDALNILKADTYVTDVPDNVVVIDALLGTGLNRAAEGWVAQFIEHINELPNLKIAIDIPSGMPADNIPAVDALILKADHTLSFEFYKRAFLHKETGVYAGDIHLLNIGLSKTFIKSTQSNYHVLDRKEITPIYKQRDLFSHKGDYGSAYLVGGSYGMMGAVVLATKAALRAGAGRVKALVPEKGMDIMQSSVPEAMCGVSGETCISKVKDWDIATAVGIGPGIGTSESTQRAFAEFIDKYKEPVVIDADGLNIMAKQQELLHKIPAESILTPHPKEFERIFGKSANSMQQLELARTQSMRYNIYIVLKGHYTSIVTPEGACWYNTSGNAGMATGGSGDILTGILTGLLAQGYEPEEAVKLGVYLHGLAGDIGAEQCSQDALIATDIINNIGAAYKAIVS